MSKGGGKTNYMYLPQASAQNSSSNTNQTTNQQSQNQSSQLANTSATGNTTNNATSSSTSTNQIPLWLQNAAQAGLTNAQGLLNKGVQTYTGDLTAGLNNYQQQAGNALQAGLNAYSPYFSSAKDTIMSGLKEGPQVNAQTYASGLSNINQYMNPYMNDVVNSVNALGAQNLNNALTQTADQAIASKAFGGSRHGVMEGVATAQNNLNTNNLLANLKASGYNQATNMLGQDIGNNLSAQGSNQSAYQNYMNNLLSGGSALAGLGTAAQNSALAGANNLMNYGNLAQNTSQNNLTAKYNQWLQQQQQPYQAQQLYNQTLSATPYSTTQTSTGNQSSTGQQTQNTTGATTGTSSGTMSGNTTGNSNTNSSGWSFSPVQQTSSSPLMQGLGGLMGLGSMFAAPAGGMSMMGGMANALGTGAGLLGWSPFASKY